MIGKKIKNIREGMQLSRPEFAEAVGVSTSALAMYERGERIPRDEIKVKIAQFAGVTVGALFFDEVGHE